MKFQRSIVWMPALGLAALSLAGLPATAAPPGEQLIDQVVKAYKDIQQYDATLRLTMSQTQGRWTSSQEGEFYIALDRPGNRLLIDSPDQLLVADGQTLFYRNPRLPGKHLQIDATAPLTSQWIVQQVPAVVFPSVPTDFAFLLADDPLAFVSQGAAGAPATLPPDPDDPMKRPRIQAALQAGTLTLTTDPKTHLIDKAVVDVDTAALGAPADTTMTYTFDIHVNSLDNPIDPERFAFDTSNSAASGSMQQMMASGSNAPHRLVGQPTPPLNLPDIDGNDHDLATDDAKVIVLDFWATWCPPCVAAMPELQAVYDWAQQEGNYCSMCGDCERACPAAGRSVARMVRYRMYHQDYGMTEYARSRYAALELKAPAISESDLELCEAACTRKLPLRKMVSQAHSLLA